MRAFGSRVTGGARPWSDLDRVVVADDRLPFERIARLKEVLEESEPPIRVDVVDWHSISEGFRRVIERRYEVVQAAGRTRVMTT